MTKQFLHANDFQRDCIRLAKQVFSSTGWRPDLILALWRGGAQPGVIASEVFDALGRPTPHEVIKCSSYTTIGQRNKEVSFGRSEAFLKTLPVGLRVLVVDDVFDTGKTAEAIRTRLPQVDLRIATVYWKPNARLVPFVPDYYVRKTDDWIVFPHELSGLTKAELKEKDPEIASLLYE